MTKGADFDYAGFARVFGEYTASLGEEELTEWARRLQEGIAAVGPARGQRP